MKDLSKMTCLEDLRRVAQRKVPKMFYDYVVSGSWSESTLHANRNDFQAIKLRQRVLVDMEGRSLESTMWSTSQNAISHCANRLYRHGSPRR